MNKRRVSSLLLALLVVAGCGQKEPPRPNIIVVVTDDQRYDFLGEVNPRYLQTPSLDRLAAEGVRYSNAFVTTSLCSPARASYLTGLYAHTHRVVVNEDMDLTARTPNIAELMQKQGYETAFIGKWHMARLASPRPGFDHWVSFHGQGHYFTNTLNVDGQWELCRNYITDELTDRAIKYLKQPHDRPFLMFLSHKAVHQPFDPADRDSNRFAGEPVPDFNDPADQVGNQEPWKSNRRPGSGDLLIKRYRQTLASVDDDLGRLLDTLDELKLSENTVVIYVGDNGYLMGEHGGLWDKRAPFEPSIRVPIIMRYPGNLKAGSVDSNLVLNLDLVPTILELAQAPVPTEIQGRSWLGPGPGRESFLYEYFASEGKVPTCLAVRTKRWKLVTFPKNPELADELFDLVNDPHETRNLAVEKARQSEVRQLREELERLKKETDFQWPKY